MRRFVISLCTALLLSTAAAQAADFSVLKDNVRGYRNLSNTPEAPSIEFKDKDGNVKTLADFKGKTVLLNLWATWCPPCIREMPALNEIAKEFKDENFVVLAIATGRQGRETPDGFLEKRELTEILSYLDPKQEFLKAFEISTLPVSFIIDAEGNMQGGVIGMTEWADDKAKAALKQVLK